MKILILPLLICTSVLAAKNHFSDLKHKINFYENSVIKEFSLTVPADYNSSFDAKEQIKYGIILEEKFKDQRETFYKAENELFKIEQSLTKRVEQGQLSEEESDNLLTSVEYARRIILEARRSEMIERYREFKHKLSIKPSLVAFHKKIKDSKLPGQCEITQAHINSHTQAVEFFIKGEDYTGNKIQTKYSVTEQQIKDGFLFTRFDQNQHYGVREKVIINYSLVQDDQSVQRFTLYENSQGKLYHAEFSHDQIQKPWIDVFGLFNIGSVSESKKIICNDNGRMPASLTQNF